MRCVDNDASGAEELDRLRTERDDWRRRAEVAEAVAAERLARAETAERALATAEAALASRAQVGPAAPAAPLPTADGPPARDVATPAEPVRPRSLLERWRRYTDTIN